MNCADFDRLWNELLDARPTGPSDLEGHLEAHAAACVPCRSTSAGYQALRRAIVALEPPPPPSAEARARLLTSLTDPRSSSRARLARYAWLPLAAAAAWLMIVRPFGTGQPVPEAPVPSARASTPGPLDRALVEAASASIELALEASAPAARIGREVLGDLETAGSPPTVAAPPDLDRLAPPASSMIQSVGERLQAGVRPLSGSARHAFGFLLGPPPSPPGTGRL